MILKLIYIVALVALSTVAVAQEIGKWEEGKGKREKSLLSSQFPLPSSLSQHDRAVERNRKKAKKLKAQHKRAHKLKSLKRDKSDILKPRFRPHPKEVQEAIERKGRRYQPRRISRPVVE